MMPEFFESLQPRKPVARTQGRLAELPASDLSKVASRAQQRQQKIVETELSPSLTDAAPVRPSKTSLASPNSGQLQNIPGVTNTVSNAAARSGDIPEDLFAPPTTAPTGLGSEPQDVEYGALSPTQRNQAFRMAGLEAVDHAIDPETKKMRRTSTGAAVISFRSPVGNQSVFLAEDGAPAHAALMQAVSKAKVRALPVNGSDDYGVGWRVHRDDRARFLKMVEYLEPGSVDDSGESVEINFPPQHQLNRTFLRAPFGSKKARK